MIKALFFLLMAAVLVLSAPFSWISDVSGQQFSDSNLEHMTTVSEYGDISIRDTISFGPVTNIPNPITFEFPTTFRGKIASIDASFVDGPEARVSTQFIGNSTQITLVFDEVDRGTGQTLVLEFYLFRAIEHLGRSQYNFQYSGAPSLNFNVASINSILVLPPETRLAEGPEGFTSQEQDGSEIWSRTDSQPSAAGSVHNITMGVTALETRFYLLGITEASRTIIVTSQGQVLVRDSLLLNNYDERIVLLARIQPIGESISTIRVLPGTNPPLFNPFEARLPDNTIDLRGLKRTITEGTKTRLIYEYPMPASQISSDGLSITIRVPSSPPADSILQNYRVNVEVPSGFFVTGEAEVVGVNVTASSSKSLAVRVAAGPAWSVSDIIPAASIIFLAVFSSAFLLTRGPSKQEEHPEEVGEVVQLVEIKSRHIIDALAEIDRKDISSQGEIQRIRKNLDDSRSRTMNRLAQERSRLDSMTLSKLNPLFILDKEVDRAARDFLSYYEQQVRRLKGKDLDRSVSSYRKRLDQMLAELAQLLHSEMA
ncbi:MAG: hypothetical protein ACE5KG_04610 [Nitrososphaerales archaeon]